MDTEKKTEPENTQALLDRKFSQQRMLRLLEMSKDLVDISRLATNDLVDTDLLSRYQKAANALDELIITEAKYQEQTMQEKLDEQTNEKRQSTPDIHLGIEVSAYDEAQEAVKFANKIQKEYSCHCTLSVKIT